MSGPYLAVEKEVDKVVSKLQLIYDHISKVLTESINHLTSLQREYESCDPDYKLSDQQKLIIRLAMEKTKELIARLTSDHRDMHSSVCKVGKAIDKNFVADFAACSKEDMFNDPQSTEYLNKEICRHFYRQGMLDIAEALMKDANLKMDGENQEPFIDINNIMESLKKKDIGPALKWAQENRRYLENHNSSLEFKLHQLQFICMMQKGVGFQNEAMQYARYNFMQFANRHERDIQNLMGMFLYLPQGLGASPYSHYLEPTLWAEIKELFVRDVCNLMGLSIYSPLSISIDAGCVALPALLNIKQVMQQRQVTAIWNGKDELPIEIEFGPDKQYHSVFACPILRQQSTEQNPPMRLVCGHVISKDALTKLGSPSQKLKCPYCPVEQAVCDAKQIIF